MFGCPHRLGVVLDRELMPAFEPPRLQYAPPGELPHALAEAVDPVTATNFRLIGTLYHLLTLSVTGTRLVAGGQWLVPGIPWDESRLLIAKDAEAAINALQIHAPV